MMIGSHSRKKMVYWFMCDGREYLPK